MSEENIELTCKGCDQVFRTFLEKMAEHNGKVVCPNCGHVHAYDEHRVAPHE